MLLKSRTLGLEKVTQSRCKGIGDIKKTSQALIPFSCKHLVSMAHKVDTTLCFFRSWKHRDTPIQTRPFHARPGSRGGCWDVCLGESPHVSGGGTEDGFQCHRLSELNGDSGWGGRPCPHPWTKGTGSFHAAAWLFSISQKRLWQSTEVIAQSWQRGHQSKEF